MIQPGQASYTYTSDGNINTKTGISGAYDYGALASGCSTVPGSANPGPHAVSTAGGTSYCYDANGNLIRTFSGTSSDKSLTWTAYDAVATIASSLADTKVGFDYGPNGRHFGSQPDPARATHGLSDWIDILRGSVHSHPSRKAHR